jgi:hypothetical protein
MTEDIERKVIEIVATDRVSIPVKSMAGKLDRQRPKLARDLGLKDGESFEGDRVYARVETENIEKARRLSDAVESFCADYRREGDILKGYIAEKRFEAETHLYFGVNPGARLSAEDYLGVMRNLGFTESTARSLYPELMEVSRQISRKRDEERSILIG